MQAMGIRSRVLLDLICNYPLNEAAQRIRESVPRCRDSDSLVVGMDVLAVMGPKCTLGPGNVEPAVHKGVNTLLAASKKLVSALKSGAHAFASVAVTFVGDGYTPLMKALGCYLERWVLCRHSRYHWHTPESFVDRGL
jgi:hypothetical protein